MLNQELSAPEDQAAGGITDFAANYFDCPYLQRFFVNPDVYLAPQAAFGPAMLPCVLLTEVVRLFRTGLRLG